MKKSYSVRERQTVAEQEEISDVCQTMGAYISAEDFRSLNGAAHEGAMYAAQGRNLAAKVQEIYRADGELRAIRRIEEIQHEYFNGRIVPERTDRQVWTGFSRAMSADPVLKMLLDSYMTALAHANARQHNL